VGARRSAAKTMPINLGVKAVHGARLKEGSMFYDAFIETFKSLYLKKGNSYGMTEQWAVYDTLKRAGSYSTETMIKHKGNFIFWEVPVWEDGAAIGQDIDVWVDGAYNRTCLQEQAHSASEKAMDRHRVCLNGDYQKRHDLKFATVKLTPARQYNCMEPNVKKSCASKAAVLHYKGRLKDKMSVAACKKYAWACGPAFEENNSPQAHYKGPGPVHSKNQRVDGASLRDAGGGHMSVKVTGTKGHAVLPLVKP